MKMVVTTKLVWPDGNWSERSFSINDDDEFTNFFRVLRAALRNGAHAVVQVKEI